MWSYLSFYDRMRIDRIHGYESTKNRPIFRRTWIPYTWCRNLLESNAKSPRWLYGGTTKKKSTLSSTLKQGYKDSNLEMTESESVALPFGDSPLFYCLSLFPCDKMYYILMFYKMQVLFSNFFNFFCFIFFSLNSHIFKRTSAPQIYSSS